MFMWKIKVNCTHVQALRLCTGRTAHSGSRGIALLFHYHGTRKGWGVSVTPRPLFTPGKYPVPIAQEIGLSPRPVWTGAENLAPTGIRWPDRPGSSQSLCRLSYPAHKCLCTYYLFCVTYYISHAKLSSSHKELKYYIPKSIMGFAFISIKTWRVNIT